MKKLNNKGYMLVEIILAFVIMFGLIYFLMDLVINLKNKNDDLVVDTIVKTDQTIISNKLEMDIDDVRKMCMLIESHMGKWNINKYSKVELPVPTSEIQRYVHRCNYLASRNYLNIKFTKLDIE